MEKVRGQLARVASPLLPCGIQASNVVARLGGKHLYALTRLTSP